MTPDEIRRSALDRIDKQERTFKLAFLGAAVIEALFFMLFFMLMDFHNRMHVLLLIATVSSYSIIVLGLVAIGAMGNRNAARVIRAIGEAAPAGVPAPH